MYLKPGADAERINELLREKLFYGFKKRILKDNCSVYFVINFFNSSFILALL